MINVEKYLNMAARLSPETTRRLLYCDGLQLTTSEGYGIQSEVISRQPALEALGLTGIDFAYRFLYVGQDKSFLDTSKRWEISEDGGVTTRVCNCRKIIPDILGVAWQIIIDTARHDLLPNFTITWALGLGTFTTDSATGNPVENTTEETAYAVLEQTQATQLTQRPARGNRFYLSGYFCDQNGAPTKTPDGFQWGREWNATWTDEQTGLEHKGLFMPTLATEEPIAPRPVDSGSQLQGWFRSLGTGAITIG